MRDGFIDCGDGEVEVGGMLGGFEGLALHQFLAFAESDGVSITCLALALHQIPRFV